MATGDQICKNHGMVPCKCKRLSSDYPAANFVYFDPNSHFWTNLDMLLNWARLAPDFNRDYLIKGLENTKKNGYELVRKSKKKRKSIS